MNNRMAVIFPFGMLLEKVDTDSFIEKLEKFAGFKFTPSIVMQAFGVAQKFNRGDIEEKDLPNVLYSALGITEKTSNSEFDFWKEWNAMITVGNIADKIQLLNKASQDHQANWYAYSDTNVSHNKKLHDTCAEQKTEINFPIYNSFELHDNRIGTLTKIEKDINAQQFNKPTHTVLMHGDPENIKNEKHKMFALKELEGIKEWCGKNNVELRLCNNSLSESLEKLFTAKHSKENIADVDLPVPVRHNKRPLS